MALFTSTPDNLADAIRRAERPVDQAASERTDAYLEGRHLWRLITRAAAQNSGAGMTLEDRRDLFGDIALAAAAWLDSHPGPYRASDSAELEAELNRLGREAARTYRERWELPGAGAGFDQLLAHSDKVAERAAATTRRRDSRAELAPGDPCDPDLRFLLSKARLSAPAKAITVLAAHPEATSAELAEVEGCKVTAWDMRVSRGRSTLAEQAEQADRCARLIRCLWPPRSERDLPHPGENTPERSGHAAALRDTGFRDSAELAELLTVVAGSGYLPTRAERVLRFIDQVADAGADPAELIAADDRGRAELARRDQVAELLPAKPPQRDRHRAAPLASLTWAERYHAATRKAQADPWRRDRSDSLERRPRGRAIGTRTGRPAEVLATVGAALAELS